jgi:hypothetical protein
MKGRNGLKNTGSERKRRKRRKRVHVKIGSHFVEWSKQRRYRRRKGERKQRRSTTTSRRGS